MLPCAFPSNCWRLRAQRLPRRNGTIRTTGTVPGVVHTDLLNAGLIPDPCTSRSQASFAHSRVAPFPRRWHQRPAAAMDRARRLDVPALLHSDDELPGVPARAAGGAGPGMLTSHRDRMRSEASMRCLVLGRTPSPTSTSTATRWAWSTTSSAAVSFPSLWLLPAAKRCRVVLICCLFMVVRRHVGRASIPDGGRQQQHHGPNPASCCSSHPNSSPHALLPLFQVQFYSAVMQAKARHDQCERLLVLGSLPVPWLVRVGRVASRSKQTATPGIPDHAVAVGCFCADVMPTPVGMPPDCPPACQVRHHRTLTPLFITPRCLLQRYFVIAERLLPPQLPAQVAVLLQLGL